MFIGLLVGALIPLIFSSISLTSVSNAAAYVVEEVRDQIKNNPLILERKSLPDYNRTIKTLTHFSINAMIIPSLIPIAIPVLVYFIHVFYGSSNAFTFGFLSLVMMGSTIISAILSISMVIAGGLWDNTKKFIEKGFGGGKGSETHKAAVTGDTVGDPYKDTTGPALNSVLKLVGLVCVLILYCH